MASIQSPSRSASTAASHPRTRAQHADVARSLSPESTVSVTIPASRMTPVRHDMEQLRALYSTASLAAAAASVSPSYISASTMPALPSVHDLLPVSLQRTTTSETVTTSISPGNVGGAHAIGTSPSRASHGSSQNARAHYRNHEGCGDGDTSGSSSSSSSSRCGSVGVAASPLSVHLQSLRVAAAATAAAHLSTVASGTSMPVASPPRSRPVHSVPNSVLRDAVHASSSSSSLSTSRAHLTSPFQIGRARPHGISDAPPALPEAAATASASTLAVSSNDSCLSGALLDRAEASASKRARLTGAGQSATETVTPTARSGSSATGNGGSAKRQVDFSNAVALGASTVAHDSTPASVGGSAAAREINFA